MKTNHKAIKSNIQCNQIIQNKHTSKTTKQKQATTNTEIPTIYPRDIYFYFTTTFNLAIYQTVPNNSTKQGLKATKKSLTTIQ